MVRLNRRRGQNVPQIMINNASRFKIQDSKFKIVLFGLITYIQEYSVRYIQYEKELELYIRLVQGDDCYDLKDRSRSRHP